MRHDRGMTRTQSSQELSASSARPLSFVPSLYLMEALPYGIVLTLSTVMYKRLGVPNAQIAFWTSMLQLPWVWKVIWGPLVDTTGTKRRWILRTQLGIASLLCATAFGLQLPYALPLSIFALAAVALCSATHDVAADGLYLLSLNPSDQSFYSGIRNSAYRGGLLIAQGGLVILAGFAELYLPTAQAWSIVFAVAALFIACTAMWHARVLPQPAADAPVSSPLLPGIWAAIRTFFAKPAIGWSIAFLLTYRLGEAQLLRVAAPFLLEERSLGGLGLNTVTVGTLYGVIGVGFLLIGGLAGGFLGSRYGLRRLLLPFWFSLNLPNLLYAYLALSLPTSYATIASCIAIEQLGYGFGFTGYMLFMLALAREGEWQASHYAICTGFMALGVMLPGMGAGWLQQALGYPLFFGWVALCSLPVLAFIRRLPLDS
jgi:PAT family beta-lactamase induction signal transducer AmpG